jgi:NB-ARC domain-containing protein
MSSADDLKTSLDRLVSATGTDEDRGIIQRALLAGHIVYNTGERNVEISGDALGTIIITGDQNEIRFDLPESAYAALRDRAFPTPRGIPPPFPELVFIGREGALHEVKKRVGINGDSRRSTRTSIVRGWPGVGKTTLVSVLSRDPDVARVYPDGVLWTSLDQKPALMSILAGWGRALGRDDLLRVATPEEAAAQLATTLHRKRMLLIVDDVWEADHGALFQRVRGADCALLITTRMTDVANRLVQTEDAVFNLPVLTEKDAVKLMRILAPAVVDSYENDCMNLVRALECLPLAIHVAARLLRAESKLHWGVAELLKDIFEGAALIEAEAPPDRLEGNHIPTVTALLKKSTDVLDEQTRDCFACLGAFAPKPATFDLTAMKAVWETEDPKLTVRKLVDHGLLEPVSGRFQMHALLVKHARSLLTD